MPDAAALAHSDRLGALLRARIDAAGGWIDFAQFMEGLLYTPGLGYYAAGAARFNQAGDFTTAPEISPLFGRTLARAIAPVLQSVDAACLLEPGAGTGQLALALLPALAAHNAVPARYLILEPSPALREQQAATLAALTEDLRARVEWVDAFPADFRGVVLANEVLDAMPVHLFMRQQQGVGRTTQGLLERGVAIGAGGQFVWSERPAADPWQTRLARTALALPPGAVFEWAATAHAWCRTLAERLLEGAVFLIDYGFAEREFFHPQRQSGTLMCHYRHHAHGDPFFMPGLQDVTAHVEFTSVAAALAGEGLQLVDFDSQGAFLLGQGLLQTLAEDLEPGSVAWLRQTSALQQLVSPAEMGEVFKVLVAMRDPLGKLGACVGGPGDAAVRMRLGLPMP